MCRKIPFDEEACDELLFLADALGFSPEMAAEYAVRLVSACVREGLLTDVPERAWPREAKPGIRALRGEGEGGKVLSFAGAHALHEQEAP